MQPHRPPHQLQERRERTEQRRLRVTSYKLQVTSYKERRARTEQRRLRGTRLTVRKLQATTWRARVPRRRARVPRHKARVSSLLERGSAAVPALQPESVVPALPTESVEAAAAPGVRVVFPTLTRLFARPTKFLLVANNPQARPDAACIPASLDSGDVVVRFNHMQNRSIWFGGRTDLVLVRATGPGAIEQARVAKAAAVAAQSTGPGSRAGRDGEPRVLAVVGEMQRSKSPTSEVLESMRPHIDGVMLLPEGRGHAPLSTGFAAVDFLRAAYPHVPIVLLGFDSHAEQPQRPGVVGAATHHSWTMWHDFGRERALLTSMADVEHCAT